MIEHLKTILSEKNVSISSEDLKIYTIGNKTPSAILFPTSINQISEIVKLAKRDGKKILISGNNSQHHFGSEIETPDWCISLHRMNKIIEHEAVDLIVTVESGVTLPQLHKFLNVHKQFLPLDLIGSENRTLGGIVATNSSGPLRLLYGTCCDLVLGMKVVLPDGTIIRVGGKTVKNVAGYDLSKLFIGSMGTLGAIAEITFKLFPLSVQSYTLWAEFNQFNEIPDLIQSVCSSNLVISRCEYLNGLYIKKFLDKNDRSKELHNMLFNVQGQSEMVTTTSNKLQQLIAERGGGNVRRYSKQNDGKLWNQINLSNSVNRKFHFNIHCQISIPKSSFGQVVNAIQNYSIKNSMSIAIQAHAGNGIINIFWDELNQDQIKSDHWKSQIMAFRQITENYQGNMVVLQATDSLRETELIWGKPGKDFSFIRAIKSRYDANQVLVAGRFMGGL